MRHRRRYRRNPSDDSALVIGAVLIGAYLLYQNSQTAQNTAAATSTGGQISSVLTSGSSLINSITGGGGF